MIRRLTMSKIKRYAEELMGEEGFEQFLDKEMEASHGGEK